MSINWRVVSKPVKTEFFSCKFSLVTSRKIANFFKTRSVLFGIQHTNVKICFPYNWCSTGTLSHKTCH